MRWGEFHSDLFSRLVLELNSVNIRYFILRNHEGLPQYNTSKDVDLVIDPNKLGIAREIIRRVYRECGLTRYYEVRFWPVCCVYGMNLSDRISIHIDLIPGYSPKGYEIFAFNDIYQNTIPYKNFKILNKLYNGLILLVYKTFCYKNPVLNENYRNEIKASYLSNSAEFESICRVILGNSLGHEICEYIRHDDYDAIINRSKDITQKLKLYSIKKSPIKTTIQSCLFLASKINRIIIGYRKYSKTIAIVGDNDLETNKFILMLGEELRFFYLRDNIADVCTIYDKPLSAISLFSKYVRNYQQIHHGRIGFERDHVDTGKTVPSYFAFIMFCVDSTLGRLLSVGNDIRCDLFSIVNLSYFNIYPSVSNYAVSLTKHLRRLLFIITPRPDIVVVLPSARQYSSGIINTEIMPTAEITNSNYYDSANSIYLYLEYHQTDENLVKYTASIIISKYSDCL